MPKEKKYLYCPKCKNYPDKIIEEGTVITSRIWDGECYEGVHTEYTTDDIVSYCEECGTKLIDK